MHTNILDAVREGTWDFEPSEIPTSKFNATSALPGSAEKLAILAKRAERGLPLWHDADRRDYEALNEGTELIDANDRIQTRVATNERLMANGPLAVNA